MTSLPPAPGEDEHPALALVNSLHAGPGGMVDDIAHARSLRGWLLARTEPPARVRVGAGHVRRAAELRAAVRELLTAVIDGRSPDTSAISLLNAAAAAAPGAEALELRGDELVTVWRTAGGDAFDQALATFAVDAMHLATRRNADLGACEAPDCVRLLVRDHGRRRWCSDRCGNRHRAARHYARHRSRHGGDGG